MGFLGEESGEEEVEITASEKDESRDETELKREVESKFGGSTSETSTDSSVDLEDLHRQNEKIISMLEDISDDEKSNDDNSISGEGLDGVL